jgi:hypothetical protein
VKANVYVDGFNLYYGIRHHARQGRAVKWLDLAALCQRLLPGDTINRIRYFTALVTPRPSNPQEDVRQQTYIRALETSPNLSVHYGHFLVSHPYMPLRHPQPGGPSTVECIKTEEKGSDVNLATWLLCDGFDRDCELAVIISNDSDLCLPIEVARAKLGLTVGVLNPHQNPSRALQRVASFYRPIRAGAVMASQFPPTLHDAHGTISKPSRW